LRVSSDTRYLTGFRAVLSRRAFQRRTAGDLEKAAPISIGLLALTFGDVQRNRLLGAQRLVPRVAIDTLEALGNFVCPGRIPDRNLIDIELLMPELHCFSDYDYDNDNDNDNDNESRRLSK
jgi:hypothetical protein